MSIQRVVRQAHAAGMPPDQLQIFLRNGYLPLPWALNFHAAARAADLPDGPTEIATGGARGPGKSHSAMEQIAVDDCQRCPGLDFLFLRKVGKAAKRSLEQLRAKTFAHIQHHYDRVNGVIRFENGSTITLGNFQTERDIDKYLGLEYGGICVEEYTQLHPTRIELLRGSLRTSIPGWRPRGYYSTNPGGVGHQAFRTKFVLPHRSKTETTTRFFPANWQDNPYLNHEYIVYLKSLTGVLGRMWRDGDWDVGAGQYFVTWDEEIHTMAPQTIQPLWPMWCSFDYGFSHPTVVQWHVLTPQNMVWTVAEHAEPRWLPPQHGEAIKEITASFGRDVTDLITIQAGHDAFAQRADGEGRTVADQYEELGIKLERANIARKPGAAEMLRRLGKKEDETPGITPTWQIFRTCKGLIEAIPAMQINPKDMEDVLKIDADFAGDNGDDPYDCARYGLMYDLAAGDAGSFGVKGRR